LDLRRRIVGQAEAIDQIVNIYRTYLADAGGQGLYLRAVGVAALINVNSHTRSQIFRLLRKYFEASSNRLIKARKWFTVPRIQSCRFFDSFWFTIHSTQPPPTISWRSQRKSSRACSLCGRTHTEFLTDTAPMRCNLRHTFTRK